MGQVTQLQTQASKRLQTPQFLSVTHVIFLQELEAWKPSSMPGRHRKRLVRGRPRQVEEDFPLKLPDLQKGIACKDPVFEGTRIVIGLEG